MRRKKPEQLDLPVRGRGGRRKGAGRPRTSRNVAHRKRPPHHYRNPVLVTLRTNIPVLRQERVFKAIRSSILDARYRATHPDVFHSNVVHFSVQHNHIHFIVEAGSRHHLIRGSQGVAIRTARAVNRVLQRTGKVWVDRYHARALKTPREVRNALVYVLQNRKKHGTLATQVDPRSSAPWFEWHDADDVTTSMLNDLAGAWHDEIQHFNPPVEPPATWLLRVGWLRAGGAISIHDRPAA